MSFFVICTFDLKNASREDYTKAYAELEKIGLSRKLEGEGGKEITLTTTTAGKFTGESAEVIRDALRERVKKAFSSQALKSEIFISVGGNWAWAQSTT